MSVGQSQMSSISTLMEASSSAAVLLGFFMVTSRRGTVRSWVRGVRRSYLVTLLRDDEPTNWLDWPRLFPRSIQGQRQAPQECEAIRHEFHRASGGQDRPSPAIPTNARFR